MPPDALTQLLSRPGDLVPEVEPWSTRAVDKRVLPELLSELVDKRPTVAARWQCANLPLDNPQRPALHLPASTCAVQLANDMVGVLKIQQNGDCTLFVRLKRAQTNAWADNHKQPRSGARMFWRALEAPQARVIFKQARAFVLEPNQVHHPYVLSILCLMSRERWTVPPAADAPTLPTRSGSFTLVGLPPLPEHFEQCLVLLGCSAAFVDDEEGDMPLSARHATRNTWGDTPRPLIANDMRDLFAFAGEELGTHANAGVFTRVIPALNKHAPEANQVLWAVREGWLSGEPALEDQEPEEPEEEEVAAVAAVATAADASADESGDEVLAPSDDEEAGASQAGAVPRSGGAASSSSSSTTASVPAPAQTKKPRAKPKAAAKKKKPAVVVHDDDDSDEDRGGDDDGAGSVGRQDADLSDVADSSEEEDSSSDSSSDSDSDAAPRRPAKRARPASSDDDDDEEEAAEAEAEAVAEEAGTEAEVAAPAPSPQLTDLLIQMAKPCHDKLQRMLRNHGPFLLARYHNQLLEDMGLLQTARSPVALLAAALSIVSTMADVHADRARGDSTLVNRAEAQRLGAMATQTRQFAEAVRALLEGAGEA